MLAGGWSEDGVVETGGGTGGWSEDDVIETGG